MIKKRRTTIRDVAIAADVSIATVSKFINGLQHFSPEVEKKLKKAVQSLGYTLNPAARSMVTGKTGSVGLAILDITNPHYTGIIKGANRIALSRNYNLLVADLEENLAHEKSLMESLSSHVDGLIVSSRISSESIQRLEDMGKPVISFGKLVRQTISTVRTDGRLGAFMIGRHLTELDRKKIAYVGYPAASWDADRMAGLSEALAVRGLVPSIFRVDNLTVEEGRAITSSLLLGDRSHDAIVACNDLVALGLMYEAAMLGYNVPNDVCITGFDNIPFSRYTHPTLTTVDMRSELIGETAMTKLLSLIEHIDEETADIVLEPRLVLGESTRVNG
jgi:DNA-binding LacI/PurR family transcriptional regulator